MKQRPCCNQRPISVTNTGVFFRMASAMNATGSLIEESAISGVEVRNIDDNVVSTDGQFCWMDPY